MKRLNCLVMVTLFVGVGCLVGCGGSDDSSGDNTTPGSSAMTKDEARKSQKADTATDLCKKSGWYNDGVCDGFCLKPESDCYKKPEGLCGGIAGLQCTGGKQCVDDPSDSCDPNNGGADCLGVCVDKPETPTGVCGGMLGLACPSGKKCAMPTDCLDCTGTCIDDPQIKTCGGLAGLQCPTGFKCVDLPDDGCDPNNNGADCIGTCVADTITDPPKPNVDFCTENGETPCSAGLKCVDIPDDGCQPNIGGPACPGMCIADDPSKPEVKYCGGLAGLQCPEGQACADVPDDGCDPANGGADCVGQCVPTPTIAAKQCGGLAGLQCPEGQACADMPGDGCDPANGGADCLGICVKQ